MLLRRGGFPPSLTTLGPCLSANRGSPLSLLLCPSFAFAQSCLPIPHDELGQVFIVCVLRRRASLHFMFPATKGENQLRYPNSFLSIHSGLFPSVLLPLRASDHLIRVGVQASGTAHSLLWHAHGTPDISWLVWLVHDDGSAGRASCSDRRRARLHSPLPYIVAELEMNVGQFGGTREDTQQMCVARLSSMTESHQPTYDLTVKAALMQHAAAYLLNGVGG